MDYIRRDIQKYEGAGSRISVPKDWDGSAIVVREKINHSKVLEDIREELQKNLESCRKMRDISIEVKTLPCSSITDDIMAKTKRDNDVCRRCPFGKKIEQLTNVIDSFYDTTKDETKRKLAEQFFEERE